MRKDIWMNHKHRHKVNFVMDNFISQFVLLIILIIICAFLSIKSPYFFTWINFRNILDSISIKLILALAMTFVIASGGIDLSVGSIVSLSGIIMAILISNKCSVLISILIGVFSAVIMGYINGALIHYKRINPFIVTLATASLYRGLALIITKGAPITGFPKSFTFWGKGDLERINPPIVIAIALCIFSIFILHRTKWGKYALALGGNGDALRKVGVKTGVYRITIFIIMGLMSGIVGLIVTARLNSAEANAGLFMEMDAITAVIMGGTLSTGGKANIIGTVIAVFLLGVIRNGLTILSISPYYQQAFIGVLLLLSVVISEAREHRKIQLN